MKKRERNREEEKEADYKGTNGSDCAHPSNLIFSTTKQRTREQELRESWRKRNKEL